MKLSAVYEKSIEWIAGACAMIALCIVCIEVFLRYFFPMLLPDWGREIVIYLFAWAIMLVGGLLIKEDRHVRADLVNELFPEASLKYFDVIVALIGIFFCVALTWFGVKTVLFAKTFEEVSDSSIQFPMYLFYLCLPVGMLFMSLHYVNSLVKAIQTILGGVNIQQEADHE